MLQASESIIVPGIHTCYVFHRSHFTAARHLHDLIDVLAHLWTWSMPVSCGKRWSDVAAEGLELLEVLYAMGLSILSAIIEVCR